MTAQEKQTEKEFFINRSLGYIKDEITRLKSCGLSKSEIWFLIKEVLK